MHAFFLVELKGPPISSATLTVANEDITTTACLFWDTLAKDEYRTARRNKSELIGCIEDMCRDDLETRHIKNLAPPILKLEPKTTCSINREHPAEVGKCVRAAGRSVKTSTSCAHRW